MHWLWSFVDIDCNFSIGMKRLKNTHSHTDHLKFFVEFTFFFGGGGGDNKRTIKRQKHACCLNFEIFFFVFVCVRVQARVFFDLTTAATHTHTQQRKMFANLFIFFSFCGGKKRFTMRIFFSDVALGEEAMDRAKKKFF